MTQVATVHRVDELRLKAMEGLLAGLTVTAAAQKAGVSRETLHRWLREDFGFQAVLNRFRREAHEAMQARLLAMAQKAASVVEQAVAEGDVKVAMEVLKSCGVFAKGLQQPGPEDPDEIREKAEINRMKLENEKRLDRLMATY